MRIIPRREQKARSTLLDEFRDPADRAANHRQPTRQAFEDHQAGGFGPDCGADQAVRRLHEARDIHLVAEEPDPRLEPQGPAQVSQPRRIWTVPDDPRHDPRRQPRERSQDDVHSLPVDQLRDHQDDELPADTEFLPERGPRHVVGPKAVGIDEMRARYQVRPDSLGFEAPPDEVTDADDLAVPAEQDFFDLSPQPAGWKLHRQFSRDVV